MTKYILLFTLQLVFPWALKDPLVVELVDAPSAPSSTPPMMFTPAASSNSLSSPSYDGVIWPKPKNVCMPGSGARPKEKGKVPPQQPLGPPPGLSNNLPGAQPKHHPKQQPYKDKANVLEEKLHEERQKVKELKDKMFEMDREMEELAALVREREGPSEVPSKKANK